MVRTTRSDIAFRILASIVGLLLLSSPSSGQEGSSPAIVTAFERASNATSFVLDITAQGQPRTRLMHLQNPPRVVLDILDTVAAERPPAIEGADIVRGIRDGLVAADRYRLIFDLAQPATAELTRIEAGETTALTLKLDASTPAAFAAAAARKPETSAAVAAAPPPPGADPVTIVLDPGHGGIDLGAVGTNGTLEKDLNLAFAKVLKARLEEDPRYAVVMTRSQDALLPLAERSAIAQRASADLFVSLHADSIRYRDLRGATVYTLADEASDPLSQEIADSENAADRFVGPGWEADTPEIHDILVDLVRRETEILSERLARTLVLNLRASEIRLINNPKRSAGFRVLRAPDIPSVLLELGYLSNADDERLMNTQDWQSKMSDAVAAAIGSFVDARSALER